MISIKNMSQQMTRGFLSLMLFLGLSLASSAQVKLYLEDFTISTGETKTVSLVLDNDQTATQMQATLVLPYGLTYVNGSVAMTSRVKGRGAVAQASTQTGKLVIVETDGTIDAGSGAVITFSVYANALLPEGDNEISLSDIVVSNADANQINTEEENTAIVTMLGLSYCAFAAPEEIELSVDEEYQVDVTLTNEGVEDLSAFSGKLALPKGLEIVEGEDGKFIYSDRTPAPLSFEFKDYEGYTTFVLSSSNNTKITGTDGVIFSFTLKATADLAVNPDNIVLSELRVATPAGASAECEDVTIRVKNLTGEQLDADKAAFEAYQTEQVAAAAELVKEDDPEECAEIVAAAQDAIEALTYDETKTLDENKANVDAIINQLKKDLADVRPLAGDITGNGDVDVDDVQAFIDILLGAEGAIDDVDLWSINAYDTPDEYETYKKYDVNGDGYFDVADAQAILNLALGLNVDGTVPEAAARFTIDNNVTLNAKAIAISNGITRYAISVEGALEYTAFQMNVKVQKGMKVLSEIAEGMTLKANDTADGHRIVGIGNSVNRANGEFMYVDVEGQGNVSFENVCFSTQNGMAVRLNMGDATGILSVNAARSQVNGTYDLSGKPLKSMQKGINIVRRADGSTKKVMVK